jgi:hypothetical protein
MLRQIIKGVRTAQQHPDCKGAKIIPDTIANIRNKSKVFIPETIQQIEFDVAVTVSGGKEKQGKGTIGVASFGIGGQASSTMANTSVSRITFSVRVVFPSANPS